MSERQINDPQSTPQAPTPVDAAAQLASARRRRFLKIGGAAVPTALTLASRPVMAWDCNTASMWGSVQGISLAHSSYLRSQVKTGVKQSLWADETYTKANWCGNTSRTGLPASPWVALGSALGKPAGWNAFKSLVISDVVPSPIFGVTLSNNLWNYLNAGADEYGYLMVVAWLNYVTLGKTGTILGLEKCLKPQSTVSLTWMGTAGGTTVTGPDGRAWNRQRVIDYLKANYVARAA